MRRRIRLLTNEDDVRARLTALRRRARHHPTTPTVDSYGQFSYRGTRIYLSPVEQRLMALFAGRFGSVVTKDELLAAWPDGGAPGSLRVHVSRLRKRLRPTGAAARGPAAPASPPDANETRSGYRRVGTVTIFFR